MEFRVPHVVEGNPDIGLHPTRERYRHAFQNLQLLRSADEPTSAHRNQRIVGESTDDEYEPLVCGEAQMLGGCSRGLSATLKHRLHEETEVF